MSFKKQREQDLKKSSFPLQIIIPSAGIIRFEVLRVCSQLFFRLKHPDMIVL
jgi:hypothetical protein